MNLDFKRTGSISQDALRLGFQTTCNKGIATLLQVNDITIEECSAFKENHINEVNKCLNTFVRDKENEHKCDFINKMKRIGQTYQLKALTRSFIPFKKYYNRYKLNDRIASQKGREFSVSVLSVSEATLDLNQGIWKTVITYTLESSYWKGIYAYEKCVFEKEEKVVTKTINTEAKKCVVQYIDYDAYHDQYIPDEAAEAAFQAKEIGMTKLLVARPKIENAQIKKDPIIVAHIGEQMFIIAWFGYDKDNHMSCNM